ncbi:MAG: DUF1705 domain-containing protein, partial [Burkholderiales bacterium]|nr:DUF1705 domain-containing protein [Burkholderiales bacterium]
MDTARARACNPLAVAVLGALWIAAVANWPLWRALAALPELASPRGALFGAAFLAVVAALLAASLAAFAWRRTIKPALALFVAVAALHAHFAGAYGTALDRALAASVLQTHAREALDLLTPGLAASVLLLAGPPIALLARVRLAPTPGLRQLGLNAAAALGALALAAALVAAFYADFAATLRNHKRLRYLVAPLNVFYAFAAHARATGARAGAPLAPAGAGAALAPLPRGARPPLLAL